MMTNCTAELFTTTHEGHDRSIILDFHCAEGEDVCDEALHAIQRLVPARWEFYGTGVTILTGKGKICCTYEEAWGNEFLDWESITI